MHLLLLLDCMLLIVWLSFTATLVYIPSWFSTWSPHLWGSLILFRLCYFDWLIYGKTYRFNENTITGNYRYCKWVSQAGDPKKKKKKNMHEIFGRQFILMYDLRKVTRKSNIFDIIFYFCFQHLIVTYYWF